MRTLYLDIFSGISGDMFLGAMIDLGVEAEALETELSKLNLDGYLINVSRKTKANIDGVKFDVHLLPKTIGIAGEVMKTTPLTKIEIRKSFLLVLLTSSVN